MTSPADTAAREAAFDDWKRRAAEADILDVALGGTVGAKLRKVTASEHAGPCPACGGEDRFSVNVRKQVFNCRGAGGGGVIDMVMHACGCDFLAACELITGAPPPGGASAVKPESEEDRAARLEARAQREREREAEDNVYREGERRTAWEMWRRAVDYAGSAAEQRLRSRGIDCLPEGCRLRAIADMPYYATGGRNAQAIHRGPAMLAPIVGAATAAGRREDGEHFTGVHLTYVDLAAPPSFNLRLTDPATGRPLDGKKVRGSQQGGHIPLNAVAEPWWLIIGEGIETVLSVFVALTKAGRDLDGVAFWSSVNLGNLGGKALGTLPHPTLKTDKGRSRRVADARPDLGAPSIVIPQSVRKVTLLGDGDSDRFTTERVLARAAARFAFPGREIVVAWAHFGFDFNDMLRQLHVGSDAPRLPAGGSPPPCGEGSGVGSGGTPHPIACADHSAPPSPARGEGAVTAGATSGEST